MEKARKQTVLLATAPYDPSLWLNRGKTLYLLSYPELAFGDAYKACFLVQYALHHESHCQGMKQAGKAAYRAALENVYESRDKKKIEAIAQDGRSLDDEVREWLWKTGVEATRLSISALASTGATKDAIKLCKIGIEAYPGEYWFDKKLGELLDSCAKESAEETSPTELKNVGPTEDHIGNDVSVVKRRPYPWMQNEMLRRKDEVLQSLKQEFSPVITGCELQYSNIQNDVASTPSIGHHKQIGFFATRRLKKGEIFFFEHTIISHPTGNGRCDACSGVLPLDMVEIVRCEDGRFCSESCRRKATEAYLNAMRGRSFDIKFRDCWDMIGGLYVRIYATIVQEDASHPLTGKFLRRYDPGYNDRFLMMNLVSLMEYSRSILESLGVDIFSDFRFDTWVLLTISFRTQRNMHTHHFTDTDNQPRPHILCTLPRLSHLFNHSCTPNITRTNPKDGAWETYIARQRIKKGEELSVDYRQPGNDSRKLELDPQLHIPCRCSRCIKEREVADRAEVNVPGTTSP